MGGAWGWVKWQSGNHPIRPRNRSLGTVLPRQRTCQVTCRRWVRHCDVDDSNGSGSYRAAQTVRGGSNGGCGEKEGPEHREAAGGEEDKTLSEGFSTKRSCFGRVVAELVGCRQKGAHPGDKVSTVTRVFPRWVRARDVDSRFVSTCRAPLPPRFEALLPRNPTLPASCVDLGMVGFTFSSAHWSGPPRGSTHTSEIQNSERTACGVHPAPGGSDQYLLASSGARLITEACDESSRSTTD